MVVFLHINCHCNQSVDTLKVRDGINLLANQSIVIYGVTVAIEISVFYLSI